MFNRAKGGRLVAAIELVSPSTKDRERSRSAFVAKCHALLQQDVNVLIVDLVSTMHFNLYAELAEALGAPRPGLAAQSLYAVSCRVVPGRRGQRVEAWEHPQQLGDPLPTLPLWLNERDCLPVPFEQTYEDTCRKMRLI